MAEQSQTTEAPPTQSNTPEPMRLDQSLREDAHQIISSLLEKYPDLRSAVVVFDYHLKDPGSLPPGVWLPRKPLQPTEVVEVCQAVDKFGSFLRKQHDDAVLRDVSSLRKIVAQEAKPDGEKTGTGEEQV